MRSEPLMCPDSWGLNGLDPTGAVYHREPATEPVQTSAGDVIWTRVRPYDLILIELADGSVIAVWDVGWAAPQRAAVPEVLPDGSVYREEDVA